VYRELSLGAPLLAILLALSACAGLPVRGTVGGQTIETRVDSEAARYYLGSYLAGNRTNPTLDARIDQIYQAIDGHLPGRIELKELSDEFSVDFAALYMADQIARVPANRRFRSAFEQVYEYTRKAFPEGRMQVPQAGNYDVLLVPTYLYKRITFTGADMAAPRKALQKVGFTCHFVETQDDGTIEANADLVAAAIRALAPSGRRLIIVSASKSGAEVALALTKLGPAETHHVAAWINTVGALQGTPLIDDRVLPEVEFIVGKVNPAGVASMTTTQSRQRFESFRIPKPVLVANYSGIPTLPSTSSPPPTPPKKSTARSPPQRKSCAKSRPEVRPEGGHNDEKRRARVSRAPTDGGLRLAISSDFQRYNGLLWRTPRRPGEPARNSCFARWLEMVCSSAGARDT